MCFSFQRRDLMLLPKAMLFSLLLMTSGTLRADQFDDMRTYWLNLLLLNGNNGPTGAIATTSTNGNYLTGGTPATNASAAQTYRDTMNTSPTRTNLWTDLPLGSVSLNIVGTFRRLEMMALAWATPGGSLEGDPGLASAISSGLDWMNTHAYTPTTNRYNNWFHWEIGGPETMLNAVTLFYPMLSSTQISNYCAAVDHFTPGGTGAAASGSWMTASNTSAIVLTMTLRGMVEKNSAKITTAQSHLGGLLTFVTSGEGFYTDGSYIFHGEFAYNGLYGLGLLGDVSVMVGMLTGTTWQVNGTNIANVYGWVTKCYVPLIYNGAMMDIVRGRAVAFSGQSEYNAGAGALNAIGLIAEFAPVEIGQEMRRFLDAPRIPAGQFHFPRMDRVVAFRNGFGFAVSMSSNRIANYESINGNNLHGWFTGDGMTYLYAGEKDTAFDGDYWPTVDPYHLPGTTNVQKTFANAAFEDTKSDQSWVGGAQVAGTYGVAGMSLHPANTALTGRKSWFMLDNEVVCLGAALTSTDAAGEIHTTAENRRLETPITSNTLTLNGAEITPAVGWTADLPGTTSSWCALSGVGAYYFPSGASNLTASITSGSGTWIQINSTETNSTVYTENYFKLQFNHGLTPTNASYAYVILPGMDAAGASQYAAKPSMKILANTGSLQAVKKIGAGVVAANFWSSGTADLITSSAAASVITSEGADTISVGVADPTQANTGSITITLNRAALSLVSADPAVTVTQLSPKIILSVNVKSSRGLSFQASFKLPRFALSPVRSGTDLQLTYPSRYGNFYQLMYKNTMQDSTWKPLGSRVTGDNTTKMYLDSMTNESRFYQMQAQ